MEKKEDFTQTFSIKRRVERYINHLMTMSLNGISDDERELILVTYYGATKELLELIDRATREQKSNEEIGAAVDNAYKEIEVFFNERMTALVQKFKKSKTVN